MKPSRHGCEHRKDRAGTRRNRRRVGQALRESKEKSGHSDAVPLRRRTLAFRKIFWGRGDVSGNGAEPGMAVPRNSKDALS